MVAESIIAFAKYPLGADNAYNGLLVEFTNDAGFWHKALGLYSNTHADCSGLVWKYPGLHDEHDAPEHATELATGLHDEVRPVQPQYTLAGHCVHSDRPTFGENVPEAHKVGDATPEVQKDPDGQ